MTIGTELSLYQTAALGMTALAWVYAWGKTHQLFNSLLSRMEKVEEKVSDLDQMFKLTPDKAMQYLHTHNGCKTIIRN